MTLSSSHFAVQLRTYREYRELTQEQLAEKTGLKPTAISHFECGQRKASLENLCRLCNALNIEPQCLLIP